MFNTREKIEASDLSDPRSALFEGLFHALNISDQSGVSMIAIPMNLFSKITVPIRIVDDEVAVTLLKMLKIFMADNCVISDGSLKSIILIAQPSENSLKFYKSVQLLRQHLGC
eukprot:c7474_g1_i1.p1 GENE.c7474_g1_i1~~c7474_g1_i1.p1  ORF type:complete len:113 (-),score=38.02 c7474_g1_i1:33-371(-)